MVTPSKVLSQLVVGLTVSVLLVVLNSTRIVVGARGALEFVLRPEIQVVAKGVSVIRASGNLIHSMGSGAQELKDLRSSRTALQQEVDELSSLRSENEALRTALGVGTLRGTATQNFHPAHVLSAGHTLMIDNQPGVRVGLTVASKEGGYIGVISSIGQTTALVESVTNRNTNIPARVILPDKKTVDAEVHGSFGGGVTVERVLTEVDLAPGSPVETRGTNDETPSGILIGWVGQQKAKDKSAVYQSASVTLAAHPEEQDVVFILAPKSQD